MSLVQRENSKTGNIELHDDALGIHMYNAKPYYKRGEWKVSVADEAKEYFPHIGDHPELKLPRHLNSSKSSIADVADNTFHHRFMKQGGKPKFVYQHTEQKEIPGSYGGVAYENTHTVVERKTGRVIGSITSRSSEKEHITYPISDQKLKLSKEFSRGVNLDGLNSKAAPHLKDPTVNMHHIVSIADSLRGKQPSFIGTYKTGDGKHKEFKTHLSPEEASAKYEEHMRKSSEGANNIVRHSPTHFEYTTGYDNRTKHNIISTPGKLVHTKHETGEYHTQKNTEIFESELLKQTLSMLSNK